MSNGLDKPISTQKLSRYAIWETAEKDGKKYSVQVNIKYRDVESLISRLIGLDPNLVFGEFNEGPLKITLTRQT